MLDALLLLCTPRRCGSALIRDYLVGNGIPTQEFQFFTNGERRMTSLEVAHNLNNSITPMRGIKPAVPDMLHMELKPADKWFWSVLNHTNTQKRVWIYLDRRNHVRHAMSMLRSMWLGEGGVFPPATPRSASEMPFDPVKLRRRMAIQEKERIWWSAFFDTYKINPHVIYYEDFIQDISETIRDIFGWLGIDGIKLAVPTRVKQAGSDIEPQIEQHYRQILDWPGGLG